MKLLLVLALMLPTFSFAEILPEFVKATFHTAYIPGGYDTNDRVQVVIEGVFEDSCLRIGPYKKVVNTETRQIMIYQRAFKYNGPCLDVLVPYTQVIELGILPKGIFTVVDGYSGKSMGELPITVARIVSPDDYLYAPVSDVNIAYGPVYNSIAVSGTFYDSCMVVSDIKAIRDGERVVSVLPIAEKISGECHRGHFPFIKYVRFPENLTGRFLLNVRSLNGQAVNKLVDIRK